MKIIHFMIHSHIFCIVNNKLGNRNPYTCKDGLYIEIGPPRYTDHRFKSCMGIPIPVKVVFILKWALLVTQIII